MTLRATSRPDETIYRDRFKCPRCGWERQVKTKKKGLCRSCRDALSPQELKEWEDAIVSDDADDSASDRSRRGPVAA